MGLGGGTTSAPQRSPLAALQYTESMGPYSMNSFQRCLRYAADASSWLNQPPITKKRRFLSKCRNMAPSRRASRGSSRHAGSRKKLKLRSTPATPAEATVPRCTTCGRAWNPSEKARALQIQARSRGSTPRRCSPTALQIGRLQNPARPARPCKSDACENPILM
jgi:hypothetical protein